MIYTTYQDSKFMQDCQKMHIQLYLKPDTFDGLKALIKQLIDEVRNQPAPANKED